MIRTGRQFNAILSHDNYKIRCGTIKLVVKNPITEKIKKPRGQREEDQQLLLSRKSLRELPTVVRVVGSPLPVGLIPGPHGSTRHQATTSFLWIVWRVVMSISPPPTTRILKAYIEALTGFSHVQAPVVSTTHCSLCLGRISDREGDEYSLIICTSLRECMLQ